METSFMQSTVEWLSFLVWHENINAHNLTLLINMLLYYFQLQIDFNNLSLAGFIK